MDGKAYSSKRDCWQLKTLSLLTYDKKVRDFEILDKDEVKNIGKRILQPIFENEK